MIVWNIINFIILGTIPDPVCKNHMTAILSNLFQLKPWAFHMIDSTAKLPSGLLTGNFIQYGNMDECLAVKASGDFGEFKGKFCMVHFPYEIKGQTVEFETGICIPSTCSPKDLKYLIKYGLHIPLPVHVDEHDCNVLNEGRPYEHKEIFTLLYQLNDTSNHSAYPVTLFSEEGQTNIIERSNMSFYGFIISILVLLMVLSTTYDYIKDKKNILLQAFSLKLHVNFLLDTNAPAAPLDFLHGVRCFAFGLVALAHVYMIKLWVRNDINDIRVFDWSTDWDHTWLTSRAILVDWFFIMGGILTSYTFLKNRDRGRKFSLIRYWIHRYMRMAPAMGMQLLLEATLTNRFGSGPKWKAFAKEAEDGCRNDWWKHMLFINNWWGLEKCMQHTWYIAADMQYNMLAPLLLIPLYRKPRLGLALTLVIGIVSCFIPFGLAFRYEEKVDLFKNAKSDIEWTLYKGSYNRIIPWLTGFALGYFMYKKKHLCVLLSEGKTIPQTRQKVQKFLIALVLWIILFVIVACVMLTVHPFIQFDYQYNAIESAFYLSATHVVISAAGALFITIIWMGYGAPLHLLLTWKFFLPISKLTYTMYLIHVLIINIRMYDARTTQYLSDVNLIWDWISCCVVTFFLSLLLTSMVEYPFSLIEEILSHKFSGDKKKPDPQGISTYGTLPEAQVNKSEGIVNDCFVLSEDYENTTENTGV